MTPESLISPDESKNCLNCGEKVPDLFCSTCGQKYETEPISLKQLSKQRWKKFQKDYRIFFSTVSGLVRNPGKVIQEYYSGRHMAYYNPFNFFLLIGSVAAFIVIKFTTFTGADAVDFWQETYAKMGIPQDDSQATGLKYWIAWSRDHYNLIFLFMMPFYALSSFLIFRKRGHNLGEHLILWFYLIGLYSLITLPTLPFIDLANPLASKVSLITMPILFGLIAWFFRSLYEISWVKAILLAVWSYVLTQILVILFSIVMGIVAVIVTLIVVFVMKKMGLR